MVSAARLKAAMEVRDVGLAVLRKYGRPEARTQGDVTAKCGSLMLCLRTPVSRPMPEPSEYHQLLGELYSVPPPENLAYGLNIWASKKVLNIEWEDRKVVLVSYSPGPWEVELRQWMSGEGVSTLQDETSEAGFAGNWGLH